MTDRRAAPEASVETEDDRKCRVCRAAERARPFMVVDDIAYLRCQHCHATYVARANLPAPDLEFKHYLTHQNDPDDPGYRNFLSKLSQPLLARLPDQSEGLDYGCGPGPALAHMMIEAGHTMRLYDPFFTPTLIHATAQPTDDPLHRTYDFITCSETAEHFHFPASEFARLDGLLRPGAWLAVMTCFQDDDTRFASWHYRKDPTHVVFYRAQTFECIAADIGWSCQIVAKDIVLMQKPPLAQ